VVRRFRSAPGAMANGLSELLVVAAGTVPFVVAGVSLITEAGGGILRCVPQTAPTEEECDERAQDRNPRGVASRAR